MRAKRAKYKFYSCGFFSFDWKSDFFFPFFLPSKILKKWYIFLWFFFFFNFYKSDFFVGMFLRFFSFSIFRNHIFFFILAWLFFSSFESNDFCVFSVLEFFFFFFSFQIRFSLFLVIFWPRKVKKKKKNTKNISLVLHIWKSDFYFEIKDFLVKAIFSWFLHILIFIVICVLLGDLTRRL